MSFNITIDLIQNVIIGLLIISNSLKIKQFKLMGNMINILNTEIKQIKEK